MGSYSMLMKMGMIVVVVVIWRVLNWVWLRPRKIEKRLRQQGLSGNSYSLYYGDLKEMWEMTKQAKSKPIPISQDIVPRVLPLTHKYVQNYGKNSFIWIGPKPMVHIMDPEDIREILTKFEIFHKPKGNPLTKLLATGLVNYEGDKWAKHRKIINPAFRLDKLKHMLPAFYLSCSDIMSKWEKMVSIEGWGEFDVWPDLQTLTSDAISRTAFGTSYEEGRRIFELQKEQAELRFHVLQSVYIPGQRFLPTTRNKRMNEIQKQVHATLGVLIDKRMKAMKTGEGNDDDLLSILLESNFKGIQRHGNSNAGMSITEVIEECKLFYFAGQETISSLLVWAMVLLSRHQNWQTLAREEVQQVLGNNKADFDGLNRLKIVTMILNETLRLYPPVVVLMRTTKEETKVGKMSLPAGVELSLPALLIQHDHEIWGDDAKEFKPERFGEGISKATKGQVSFFPFSWGPRICIGQTFAMIEAKMVLAMILQRFSFELSPSYAHAPYTVITLQPQHGAHLVLHKI